MWWEEDDSKCQLRNSITRYRDPTHTLLHRIIIFSINVMAQPWNKFTLHDNNNGVNEQLSQKRQGAPSTEESGGELSKAAKRTCSHEGCTNLAQRRGVCDRHGAKSKCSEDGCTNAAVREGFCFRHGGKVTCSHEGCTNLACRRGVCATHGAKPKCSEDGCTNIATKGGLCTRHGAGAKKYICGHEGCTNVVKQGGLCKRHGANTKKYICRQEGCSNNVVRGGVCIRHGAKETRKTCSHEGCTNIVVKEGVCVRHGAKRKLCSVEGCTSQVIRGGVCWRHGANDWAKKPTCSLDGCTNKVLAEGGNLCLRHAPKQKTNVRGSEEMGGIRQSGGALEATENPIDLSLQQPGEAPPKEELAAAAAKDLFLTNEKAHAEVLQWLLFHLPRLQKDDAKRYCERLMEDGFDSTDVLCGVREEDLHFMKKGHKRMLIERVKNALGH